MKKLFVSLIVIAMVLLTGCSSKEETVVSFDEALASYVEKDGECVKEIKIYEYNEDENYVTYSTYDEDGNWLSYGTTSISYIYDEAARAY